MCVKYLRKCLILSRCSVNSGWCNRVYYFFRVIRADFFKGSYESPGIIAKCEFVQVLGVMSIVLLMLWNRTAVSWKGSSPNPLSHAPEEVSFHIPMTSARSSTGSVLPGSTALSRMELGETASKVTQRNGKPWWSSGYDSMLALQGACVFHPWSGN